MAHPSGSKTIGPCRYCGKRYKITNWMRRREPERDAKGYLLSDTHLIACHKKRMQPNHDLSDAPVWHCDCLRCARAERDRLRGVLKQANDQAEHFEREWYLRVGEIEDLRGAIDLSLEENGRLVDADVSTLEALKLALASKRRRDEWTTK